MNRTSACACRLCFAVLAILASACDRSHVAVDAGSDGPVKPADLAPPAAPDGGAPFALGAEYADTGLAAPFGALGIVWTKTHLEAFSWGAVEHSAPAAAHAYDWSCTDATITEFQRAGLIHIQSYLTSQCDWGDISKSNFMPKPERMADYRAWVQALVERYDGDGNADMPGLSAPVEHWVVGGEWTGFWPGGNADDYLALLAATREAARAADAGAQIGLIPFMLVDVFSGNPPSAQQIADRLRDPPPPFRNSTAGMSQLLDHPERFDYVDAHSLGDYTEVGPLLAWLRGEMQRRGYSRPIWLDDAFPISYLANAAWPLPYPVTQGQKAAISQALLDVARLVEPAYSRAQQWTQTLVARGVIQKTVTAAGEGAAGIQLGNTEDWMPDTNLLGLRETAVTLYGAAATMGLVDVTHAKGLQVCAARTPGAARAAAANLQLLTDKVIGFEKVEKLAANRGTGLWAWRFTRGSRAVVVAWNEDGILQLPGEAEAVQPFDVALPDAASARITHAATLPGVAPVTEIVPVKNGLVTVPLDSTPVFIEPQ